MHGSEARKQSILFIPRRDGLLRFARNDLKRSVPHVPQNVRVTRCSGCTGGLLPSSGCRVTATWMASSGFIDGDGQSLLATIREQADFEPLALLT